MRGSPKLVRAASHVVPSLTAVAYGSAVAYEGKQQPAADALASDSAVLAGDQAAQVRTQDAENMQLRNKIRQLEEKLDSQEDELVALRRLRTQDAAEILRLRIQLTERPSALQLCNSASGPVLLPSSLVSSSAPIVQETSSTTKAPAAAALTGSAISGGPPNEPPTLGDTVTPLRAM